MVCLLQLSQWKPMYGAQPPSSMGRRQHCHCSDALQHPPSSPLFPTELCNPGHRVRSNYKVLRAVAKKTGVYVTGLRCKGTHHTGKDATFP